MLFPAKMAEVEILVHNSVKLDVLNLMQREGFMHIEHHKIKDVPYSHPSEDISKIVDYQFRIGKIMGILNIACVKKGGFKEMLSPSPPEKYQAEPLNREEIIRRTEESLRAVEEKILRFGEEWEAIGAELEKIKTQKAQISQLINLPFDLRYLGEGIYVSILAGQVRDVEPLLKIKSEGEAAVWYRERKEGKEVSYIVVIAYHLKDRRDVESALRFAGFIEFELYDLEGKPVEVLKKLNHREKELKKEREDLKKKIGQMRREWYPKIAVLYDELENEKLKEEIENRFGKTEYTTVIRGYVKKNVVEEKIKKIESAAKGLVYAKWKEAKGDDVPSAFENPRILKPFQAFVEMYSIPKYGHIEPTVIIAPLFVAYFGLTLGDAGYGIIMTILGYLLWFHIGKYNWTNRTLGKILFASGISAIFFGAIQGSIFGPLNQYNPLTSIISYQPLMDTMRDPVTLLVIALIVGISQISLGLILGAYHHLRYRQYGDFLTSELSWFLLLPSGGLLIGYYFNWWGLSSSLITASWIVLLIALIFLSGLPAQMISKGSEINTMAFFDITGMIGDWLSYSRLLALDLATSGLALTVNLFAAIIRNMASGGESLLCCMPILIIGIALFALYIRNKNNIKRSIALLVLIFGIVGVVNYAAALWLFIAIFMIVGHIGNSILQSLGSFVHSLRLQYVEFFSRFYEGDGVKFNPFREVRRYSKLGGVKK